MYDNEIDEILKLAKEIEEGLGYGSITRSDIEYKISRIIQEADLIKYGQGYQESGREEG
jgi:hypothetical protein